MKIECTNKLLDYLGVKPEVSTAEVPPTDPLFSWTANLITVNRHETVLFVNPLSRCVFIVYGITVKTLSELSEYIRTAIYQMLLSEFVDPKIAQKYIDDLGESTEFVKNSSRSNVSICNYRAERVKYFEDLMQDGDLYQTRLMPMINDEFVRNPEEKYNDKLAFDIFTGLLGEKYGTPVYGCKVFELDVTLNLHTTCKRTLKVPASLNFYQLHRIIQNSFNWKDSHMHEFSYINTRENTEIRIETYANDEDDYDDIDFGAGLDMGTDIVGRIFQNINKENGIGEEKINELLKLAAKNHPQVTKLKSTETLLCDYFPKHKKITYEYDFGDSWEHTIVLKKVIENCNDPLPCCTKAVGAAPVDDCGGVYGYMHMCEVLQDPKNEEYDEICDFLGDDCFPEPDLKNINFYINLAYRQCMPYEAVGYRTRE